MANNNDMITLNIYNQPPPRSVEETAMNFNQTDQDINLNIDKPGKNPIFYDNVRNEQNNYNSAPRGNNNKRQRIQNTTDESSDSIETNPNNVPNRGAPIQNLQYQQPVQPIYQPVVYRPTPVGAPIATPVMAPYNMQYATPVVVQGNNNTRNAVNNAPKTFIIKKKEKPDFHKEEDCCAGFLAGCAACLTICCMISLCCPGPHGPHGRRGRW